MHWMTSRYCRFCGLFAASFLALVLTAPRFCAAGVGDPQLRTNNIWYPGELACADFDRLFATQAELYRHVTGREVASEQDKVIASWLWRNTHYFHGEPGAENLWGTGFKSGDNSPREYWSGLFAHGFGLCGTTHAQWTAEMQQLLGHNRARVVGTSGHNSFEVFLRDGPYKKGQWALLDHDLSTIIFDNAGQRLLSIREVSQDVPRWTRRNNSLLKQNGWLVCGLHPDDGGVYDSFRTAEYLAGYSGPPPLVHLRRGESLRRYLEPGLEDGQTFVFWGVNSNTGDIAGPERSLSWVNQPEKMFGSKDGAGYYPGRARYGNAVYTYAPDFTTDDYREGVVEESDKHLVFEFYSPYIIGSTPASGDPWSIYEPGGRNGLVISGSANCDVSISVDQGASWQNAGQLHDRMDLTDFAKGYRQYLLRFGAGAKQLATSQLEITTVCQANAATMPRLVDEQTTIHYKAFHRGVISAGPTVDQCRAYIVEGALNSPRLTMGLATPRNERIQDVYAVAHVNSSNPPDPDVNYSIDLSLDGGATWQAMVEDWHVTRVGEEPMDFWSQSFCWGIAKLDTQRADNVRVRFHNTGGKSYGRAEVHLTYEIPASDSTEVTFSFSDDSGSHESSHMFQSLDESKPWVLPTGRNVKTHWVQMRPVTSQ